MEENDPIKELTEKVREMGPKRGDVFLMRIDDLICFACSISAACEELWKKNKSFIDLSDEEKEMQTRICLSIVEISKKIYEDRS